MPPACVYSSAQILGLADVLGTDQYLSHMASHVPKNAVAWLSPRWLSPSQIL